MYTRGTYVYDYNLGFGVVINAAQTKVQTAFETGQVQEVSPLSLSEIKKEIVDYIKNNAVYYYEVSKFKVNNISFARNGISGEVRDGYIQRPTIAMQPNGTVNARCSCNGKRPCIHIKALLYACQSIFSNLDETVKIYDKLDGLKDKLLSKNPEPLSCLFDKNFRLSDCLKINEALKSEDREYILNFLDYIKQRQMPSSEKASLIECIVLNNSNYNKIINADYKHHLCNDNIEQCKEIIENISNYEFLETEESYIYNFVNDADLKTMLRSTLENYISPKYDDIIRYIAENTEIDKDIEEIYDELARDYNEGSTVTRFFNYLSIDKKKKLMDNQALFLYISFKEYQSLSTEEKEKYATNIKFKDRSEVSEFLACLKTSKNYTFIYEGLCLIKKYGVIDYFKSDINKILKRMPDSNYLASYLLNNQSLSWRYGYYNTAYMPGNRTFFDRMDNFLFRYFHLGLSGNTYEDNNQKDGIGFYMNYQLLDAAGNMVLKVTKYDTGEILCIENHIDGEYRSEVVEGFIYYADQLEKDKIERFRQELFDDAQKAIQEKKLKKLREKINDFDDAFNTRSISLRDGRKASVEYIFNIDRDDIFLCFKIGIDKKYVVKDAHGFLHAFLENRTVRYGKNLELTHSLENLENKDAAVIGILMDTTPVNYYDSGREMTINKHLFEKIINLLAGETVTVDDVEYLVRLKKINPNISIDENYNLNFKLIDGNYTLLDMQDNILILNKTDRVIDICETDKENRQLVMFSKENNNLCIESVKEEFKDKIYARFSGSIEVADKLKDDFKLNLLDIDAYFDYDNKKVLVATKYRINDKEVNESQIVKTNDRRKYEDYQNILQSYGFKNSVLADDEQILTFFNMDFKDIKRCCNVYLSESIKNKQLIAFRPGQIRISYNNNLMSAFLDESQFTNSELEEIIKAYKRKKKYVLLKDDRIIDFSDEKSREFFDTVEDMGLNVKKLKDENRINMVQGLKALAHEENCTVDDYLKNMVNDITGFKKDKTPLPDIKAELRDYQVDGYRWLKNLCKYNVGGILADDMGLGKTLEIITLIASDNTPKPNLIVCPKSLIFNWKNEFNRFAPEEEAIEIYGNKNARDEIISHIDPEKKVNYITSYDSLRNDIESYKCPMNLMVIDEAQYIKNVNALKTQSVKQIEAAHKLALTGTPIENNIIDLWSIFDFIMPGYFEPLEKFRNKYNASEEFVEIVARRIAPFVLRRTKANVLKDLPEKFERIMSAEMPAAQRKVYDAFKKQAKDAMNANGGKAFDMLPYLTKLRQVCVDPGLLLENYHGEAAKLDLLMELVNDYLKEGHRILIFSQFVKALEAIEKRLEIPYFKITGDTDSKIRLKICEDFNNGSEENIVLISLKAGGTGLNLTGADTVIHLDPWWNVSAENQASDRSHRIGQTRNVEVIKLICEDSIEQRVIELQNKKKDLIDRMISNDDSSVISASLEDIRFILD